MGVEVYNSLEKLVDIKFTKSAHNVTLQPHASTGYAATYSLPNPAAASSYTLLASGLAASVTSLELTGGSAAAKTIAYASSAININNGGLIVADTGAVTWGPAIDTPYTSYHQTNKNVFSPTPTGVTSGRGQWFTGANTYIASGYTPTRLQGLTGAHVYFGTRTADNLTCFSISANAYNDSATTATKDILALTAEGVASINTTRTKSAHKDVFFLRDNVTGAEGGGYGSRITRLSNSDNAISSIGFESNEAAGGGANNDTQLSFYTQAAAGALTRQMRIGANGEVSIGASTSSTFHSMNNTAADTTLYVRNYHASTPEGVTILFVSAHPANNTQKFLHCLDDVSSRCIIYSDGDVWTADAGKLTSDPKLKTNIQDATGKLDDIMKLRVRNFEWTPEYYPGKEGEKKIGFLSTEFAEVFPKLVNQHNLKINGKEDTYDSIRYGALIPILVKAMQEQQEIIDSLKARIEKLEKINERNECSAE